MNDLEAHERECAVRYKNIEERLDRGTERMNRIEMSVYALYPFSGWTSHSQQILGVAPHVR